MNFRSNWSAGLVVEMGRQPERGQSGILISKILLFMKEILCIISNKMHVEICIANRIGRAV
jgi:hypothetical protein